MNNKNNKIIFLLVIIIIILLYLLIQKFGYLENQVMLIPTGNVDIFEIDCECCKDDKAVFNEENNIIKYNKTVSKEKDDTNKNELDNNIKDLDVYDNYKIWDSKELRIFSNPAYEYKNIIAPGSFNSYAFVIRNNNNFDIIVDIEFEEMNDKNINMKYKLKSDGVYLIGNKDSYESIKNKIITQVKLSPKEQKSFILDWKWIDSDNDTQIGIDAKANYKLSIEVGAN